METEPTSDISTTISILLTDTESGKTSRFSFLLQIYVKLIVQGNTIEEPKPQVITRVKSELKSISRSGDVVVTFN